MVAVQYAGARPLRRAGDSREVPKGDGAAAAVNGTVVRPRLVGKQPPRPHLLEAVRPQVSLPLANRTSYGNWLDVGVRLSALATASAWCLGDWLIYGETYFPGRYRDAIEQTALEYKTLRNYAWVARRFTPQRRHGDLSFGHHAEVAGLAEPEQDFWLRKAERHSWSRNELRKQVRASLRERAGGEAAAEADPQGGQAVEAVERLPIGVTGRQLGIIQQAAAKTGLSVDVWAAQVLEKTAQHILADGRY